jgi:hypothetical protein
VTTVSLLANPNFGRTLTHINPGATWRVGARVTF